MSRKTIASAIRVPLTDSSPALAIITGRYFVCVP